MRSYSMAYLTANGLARVAAIELAAKLGFDAFSFRLLPAGPGDNPPPLMSDDGLVARVTAALADTGLAFSDAEMIRLDAGTELARFRPFLDRIEAMGARHILVAGDDTDKAPHSAASKCRKNHAPSNWARNIPACPSSNDLEQAV
ncbi:MAG: hypothetical protein RLZ26_1858 [Pseudomonadota bacterium]|jgi:hypothetical protein